MVAIEGTRIDDVLHRLFRLLIVALFANGTLWSARSFADTPQLRVLRVIDDSSVELSDGRSRKVLQRGTRFGVWTLVDIIAAGRGHAVLEDFGDHEGHMLFVDENGVRIDLPKSQESSAPDADTYLGRPPQQILDSSSDVLANHILAMPGDPQYAAVARLLPPIVKVKANTFSFIGTPDSADKIGFNYGGRSANFDPAVYQPSIVAIRDAGKVWHGLVGGYLPVLRFVYPEADGDWTELLAFAPLHSASSGRTQPAWYRVSRIEHGELAWSRYFDSYHPFPPRQDSGPQAFYTDLEQLKSGWDAMLATGMTIKLPDERMANMARFGMVRAIMTRVGDFPKYGAVDKDYGGSEHDGFPDTFNVETTAMIEWGLLDRAARYIDNYLGEFVRDDGSLRYRGPQTGQYGRMLTVLAQYVAAGGDPEILLRQRGRIEGITNLLLEMRTRAQQLPRGDAAYGMLAGWSEADSSLEAVPARYVQPYFSNSTEAARGFRDLGRVWSSVGRSRADAELIARGEQLIRESAALRKDIDTSISRSLLRIDNTSVLPAIAGVAEPFHIAVRRDPLDPQFRGYRAYMEMLYSGILSTRQVQSIVDYRSSHSDVILGVPTAYGYRTGETAGFLAYGHGYGLIQSDRIREALLMTYSEMAHQYTRGMWLAPETRRPLTSEEAAPYCTPAQLVVTLMTRWLLVFEDPQSEVLWLGKALPRQWLEEGKEIAVANVPTRWGRIGFSIRSHLQAGTIEAQLALPDGGLRAQTRLRLRAPGNARLRSVMLNGKRWTQFDPASESISIPQGMSGMTTIEARY